MTSCVHRCATRASREIGLMGGTSEVPDLRDRDTGPPMLQRESFLSHNAVAPSIKDGYRRSVFLLLAWCVCCGIALTSKVDIDAAFTSFFNEGGFVVLFRVVVTPDIFFLQNVRQKISLVVPY